MKEGSRCGRSFKRNPGKFPFCTERCRLLDLRDGLDGNHCFSTQEASPEDLSEGKYVF